MTTTIGSLAMQEHARTLRERYTADELATMYASQEATLDSLAGRITELETQLGDERRRANQAALQATLADDRLENFREQVRDVAIRVADEQRWCLDGLNQVLDELDLPRRTITYSVEVTVTARQTVTVSVEADSEDDAREKAEQNEDDCVTSELSDYSWEVDDSDSFEIESVDAE